MFEIDMVANNLPKFSDIIFVGCVITLLPSAVHVRKAHNNMHTYVRTYVYILTYVRTCIHMYNDQVLFMHA